MYGTAFVGLVFLLAHTVCARLLRVKGYGAFRLRPAADAAACSRGTRIAIRASGPWGAYLAVALLYGIALSDEERATTRLSRVLADSPAQAAGLGPGDRILEIGGVPARTWEDVAAAVRAAAGAPIEVTFERSGNVMAVRATPGADGKLGIVAQTETVARPFGAVLTDALIRPLAVPARFPVIVATLVAGHTADGQPAVLAGPVAVVKAAGGESRVPRFLAAAVAAEGALVLPLFVLFAIVSGVVGERHLRRVEGTHGRAT